MNAVIARITNKTWWTRTAKTLKYSLYVITHPFDGFWDLTHEKRGSIAAANVITALVVLTNIWRAVSPAMWVNLQHFNAFMYVAQTIVPMALWSISNWAITTLFNGKGRLREIYMATAYAFTPYVIMNIVVLVISPVLINTEWVLVTFFLGVGTVWSVGLVLAAMMMIHDYSLSKTIVSSAATVIGIGVMVFVFGIFFSLVSDGIAFIVSVYRELVFRLA
jgi:hypothetical protein